jgi:hypothetical protein
MVHATPTGPRSPVPSLVATTSSLAWTTLVGSDD